jgi:hypothetical protein
MSDEAEGIPTRELPRCVTLASTAYVRGSAKVGDKLVTRDFDTGTRGFAASDDPGLAVCVLPGTELAFAGDVACLPAGLLGWKTKNNQPPNGHLSTGQQGQVGRASRCARISGRAHCTADAAVRGSGSNGASAACAANERGRGRCPEARHLRGLVGHGGSRSRASSTRS